MRAFGAPRRRKRALAVRAMWARLRERKPETTTVGVSILRRLLARRPAFVQLFTFRSADPETLFVNAKVKLHGKLLADALNAAMEALPDEAALLGVLGDIGERHGRLYSVKPGHYAAMGEAVGEELRDAAGEEWNDEADSAWKATWELIAETMMAGGRPGG